MYSTLIKTIGILHFTLIVINICTWMKLFFHWYGLKLAMLNQVTKAIPSEILLGRLLLNGYIHS